MSTYPGWWQERGWQAWLLLPVSWTYRLLRRLHECAYTLGLKPVYRASVPVLVVGNVTVGGTGKSPLVAEIVRRAASRSLATGVVSRGFGRDGGDAGGGGNAAEAMAVDAGTDPARVGDEPVMLARELGVPVYVARRRATAVAALLRDHAPDLIVADDGLQHHALARDAEIVVIDGTRGFGNAWLLPAGPLREPLARLGRVDIVAVQREQAADDGDPVPPGLRRGDIPRGNFRLHGERLRRLSDGETTALAAWRGQTVHALAGIGHPERFFRALEAAGLEVRRHAFADHHTYRVRDLDAMSDLPIVVTGKDAVKIERLPIALERVFELPVRARVDRVLSDAIDTVLEELAHASIGRRETAT